MYKNNFLAKLFVIVGGLIVFHLGIEHIKSIAINTNKAIQPNSSKANTTYLLASTFTENTIK